MQHVCNMLGRGVFIIIFLATAAEYTEHNQVTPRPLTPHPKPRTPNPKPSSTGLAQTRSHDPRASLSANLMGSNSSIIFIGHLLTEFDLGRNRLNAAHAVADLSL